MLRKSWTATRRWRKRGGLKAIRGGVEGGDGGERGRVGEVLLVAAMVGNELVVRGWLVGIASNGCEVADLYYFVRVIFGQFILCILCAYTGDRNSMEFQATKYR